jgi:hypothetical protein
LCDERHRLRAAAADAVARFRAAAAAISCSRATLPSAAHTDTQRTNTRAASPLLFARTQPPHHPQQRARAHAQPTEQPSPLLPRPAALSTPPPREHDVGRRRGAPGRPPARRPPPRGHPAAGTPRASERTERARDVAAMRRAPSWSRAERQGRSPPSCPHRACTERVQTRQIMRVRRRGTAWIARAREGKRNRRKQRRLLWFLFSSRPRILRRACPCARCCAGPDPDVRAYVYRARAPQGTARPRPRKREDDTAATPLPKKQPSRSIIIISPVRPSNPQPNNK